MTLMPGWTAPFSDKLLKQASGIYWSGGNRGVDYFKVDIGAVTTPCHCAADVFPFSDFSRGGMVGDHPNAGGDHYLGIFEWHGYHVLALCGAAHWTNMTPMPPNVTISF